MKKKIAVFTSHRYYIFRVGILLIFTSILFGCESDDDQTESSGITGEWLLIEMLADPGDGSGIFMPVDSSKRLTLFSDGTFTSNGDICSFSALLGVASSGNYQESENGYTIDCESPFPTPLRLSLDNGYLILAFSCIEPCLQKFERVD